MKKRALLLAAAVVAVLVIVGAYLAGYEPYRTQHALSGHLYRGSQGWSMLSFDDPAGKVLAEFNFTVNNPVYINSTNGPASFAFIVWHAEGFRLERLNLTFGVSPYPAAMWVGQFSYYTGQNPPLNVDNQNYTGGQTGASGAVLTLSGFPSAENPTTLYGAGLNYKNIGTAAGLSATNVKVQLVLDAESSTPFVGATYSGEASFTIG